MARRHLPAERGTPPRRPGLRSVAAVAAATLTAVALPSCGTRLPAGDFGTHTPTSRTAPITVGIVTSATSPVGGGAFTGPRDGARAYFAALNAKGGLHGHPVKVVTCDDGGSGSGNTACVRKLVDQDKVLALVATTALNYAGAPYVSSRAVPDIGGQPIGTAYDTYPHLYGIYGSNAPRNGTTGWNGELAAGTEIYRYFKRKLGARTAAVVYYNQADSARYAQQIKRGLKTEGYKVVSEEVDFALPAFPAVAADLRARGVDVLFDAMDTHGNSQLCQHMQAAGVKVAAKVSNVQNWASTVPDDYRGAPGCRDALWATGSSRNYDDTAHPQVRAFRADMDSWRRQHGGRPSATSQWQLEGWAAAMWFTDALSGCPSPTAQPKRATRACIEHFMLRNTAYDARGLLLPASFTPRSTPPKKARNCLSVGHWQDSANHGHGGWVTPGPGMTRTCFTVPMLPYRP